MDLHLRIYRASLSFLLFFFFTIFWPAIHLYIGENGCLLSLSLLQQECDLRLACRGALRRHLLSTSAAATPLRLRLLKRELVKGNCHESNPIIQPL